MQVQAARAASRESMRAEQPGYGQSVWDRYSSDLYDLGAIEVAVSGPDEVTATFDHTSGSMAAAAADALVRDTIDGARIVIELDDGRKLPGIDDRLLAQIAAPRAQAIDGVERVFRLQRVGDRNALPLAYLLRAESSTALLRLEPFFAHEIGGVPIHLEHVP